MPINGDQQNPAIKISAKKSRRPYSRHGKNALMARIKLRGLHAIDMRTSGAQALIAWRKELFADLGGEKACSSQQKAIVEIAIRTRLFVEALDVWILEQQTIVSRKQKAVLPVVIQRQQFADALSRYMAQLGLERKATETPDLKSYLTAKAKEGIE